MNIGDSLARLARVSPDSYLCPSLDSPEQKLWIAVLQSAIHDFYFPRSGLPKLPSKMVYAQNRANIEAKALRQGRTLTPEDYERSEERLREKIKRYKRESLNEIRNQAKSWLSGGSSDDVGSLPWVCESLWPGQGVNMAEKISRQVINGRKDGTDVRCLIDNKKQT